MHLHPAGGQLRRACVAAFAAALTAAASTAFTPAASAQPLTTGDVTAGSSWSHPTASDQPMVRAWWPDAASGSSQAGLKLIQSHINGLAAGGIGGLEIAFLADRATGIPASASLPTSQQLGQPGVDQSDVQTSSGQCCVAYTNAEAKTIGFGSQNWQNTLTQIFKTANADKMHVDLTLSQHWPLAFNDIDPNDIGQQQQAVTAYSPITTTDAAKGRMALPLPATRLQDQDNVPFIFVNHYAAATIMKVASVSSDGTPTFSYASLTDASKQTTKQMGPHGPKGHAAGIMNAAWIAANPNTFTGTIASGSTTISNVSSISGATTQAGSLLTGAGIPDGTYIVSVGQNSLTISQPATASATESIDARWNLNTVNADWGPDPSGDPDGATFTGKIDAEGDRRRMADWQYEYTTRLNSATLNSLGCTLAQPGAALAAGDCVLFGTYYQGTGQTRSGGVNEMEYNREYVSSIYDTAGTDAITNFWDNRILGTWKNGVVTQPLGDTELLDLIHQNAAANPEDAVFEDSYELSRASSSATGSSSSSNNLWAADLLREMTHRLGYDAARYAPLLAGGTSFDTSSSASELSTTRVTEDMTKVLGQDYTEHHVDAIQKWAEQTLGYNYKVQAEAGAQGITGTEPDAGIQEGDNGATDDAWRNLQGAANLNGTNLVSDEALTFGSDYTTDWLSMVQGLDLDWAGGANRVNMHGSPFNTTFNHLPAQTTEDGVSSEWPGWEFQHGGSSGYGVFDARQPWWPDMTELTGYIGHTQAVLQGGVAKPDIAVLEGTNSEYTLPGTNSLQDLLDAGWSYNIIDERMLFLPNAKVSGGERSGGTVQHAVLDAHGPTNGVANGPAYRAIVLDGVTELKPRTVLKLIADARKGLPVILFNSDITRVYGTNQPGGGSTSPNGDNDTALAADVAKLLSAPNVYTITSGTEAQLISKLDAVGVTSAASYSAPGLETLHREIGGNEYYYLYSSGTTLTANAAVGDTGITVSSTAGLKAGDQLILGDGASSETVTIASIPSPAPTSGPNVQLTAPLTKAFTGAPASTGGPPGSGGSTATGVSPVVDVPVTLTGDGQPYELNAWSGKTTPIPDYSSASGGDTVSVTLQPQQREIIEIAGTGAALHAVSSSGGQVVRTAGRLALRSSTAGNYSVRLSNGKTKTGTISSIPSAVDLSSGWNLTLDSYGPDPSADAVNPEISSITTTQFSNALGSWSSLPATSGQLSALGVSSMSQVSGIGHYSDTFQLPSSWTSRDGADLTFAHGSDIITAVTINGHTIRSIDQVTDTVDAGPYLHAGSNSIEVKLDSLFGNRVGRSTQSYGLTGVTFTPYVEVPLS